MPAPPTSCVSNPRGGAGGFACQVDLYLPSRSPRRPLPRSRGGRSCWVGWARAGVLRRRVIRVRVVWVLRIWAVLCWRFSIGTIRIRSVVRVAPRRGWAVSPVRPGIRGGWSGLRGGSSASRSAGSAARGRASCSTGAACSTSLTKCSRQSSDSKCDN